MNRDQDYLHAAKRAFWETIRLKMQQLRHVVPKGSNSELTGSFVEELVRGFIQEWIQPSLLMPGTFFSDTHPHIPPEGSGPKQIDGIIYDPRLGPPVIRGGSFLVVHPMFCRGVIEIKSSCSDLRAFENRLLSIYDQYLSQCPQFSARSAMGIVIHDPDPKTHSSWHEGYSLFDSTLARSPVFLLFKEEDDDYEPYEPAIDAMIRTIFRTAHWPISCVL